MSDAPTPEDRDRAFRAERRRRALARGDIQRAAMARLDDLLAEISGEIAAALADQPSDYQLWRLPRLAQSVAEAKARLAGNGAEILQSAVDDAWTAGQALVEAPLAAGGIDLTGRLPSLDLGALVETRRFMVARMRGLSDDLAARISGQLHLVVGGVIDPGTATARVEKLLTEGGRRRALGVVRTEVGGAFSAAAQARLEQAARHVPGLQKQWRRSGKIHSRLAHDLADGQVRDVDEPFDVGGIRIPYPRAPSVPPAHRINCGCESLPHMANWEMATPGRRPFTPQETRLNPTKRDLEDALSGGFDPEAAVRGLIGGKRFRRERAWVLAQRDAGRLPEADGLSIAEAVAVRQYTRAQARQINAELRSGRPSRAVADFARVVEDGLAKMPAYDGLVSRGEDLTAEASAGLVSGATITVRAFWSASTDLGHSRNHRFVVVSGGGRSIVRLSHYSGESEVLWPPGAKFRILEVDRSQPDGIVRVMLEDLSKTGRMMEAAPGTTAPTPADRDAALLARMRAHDAANTAYLRAHGPNPAFETDHWRGAGEGMIGELTLASRPKP
ncbi:hypothetical protein [Roseospirillum parvum]|uniref:NAD(+)--protein-arginine ADP-ribosyltransferase n=1 Tax=Roseospirillum parvum TaxID=83401 RepID=A0A1G8EXZ9_9PROT|nr:hypothetical protein [Roseospirillum parvum]SDH74714.1 hypothetical protein SAMN05421742_11175 [Roseospirillum parvum]